MIISEICLIFATLELLWRTSVVKDSKVSSLLAIDSNFFKTQLATKINLADSNKIYITPTKLGSLLIDTTYLNNSITANTTAIGSNTASITIIDGDILIHANTLNAATSNNIISTLVQRDGLGNFAANIITGSLSGTSSTANLLTTPRNINGTAFDGSADVTVTAESNTLSGTTLASNIVSSSLTSVGTITSGVWSGTAVAVEKGGTGATTASAARTNLGLEIGTNVQAPLVAGTDYLAPTGSAASLTNFPTFNQNTTGNAATATTAGNITATANTTLTSLSNLATVGTITSGVWSGTAIDLAHGGLGSGTTQGEILKWGGSSWGLTGGSSLAIGTNAGAISQGANSLALGNGSGASNQGLSAIAIGLSAGQTDQSTESIAIGTEAALHQNGEYAIAIGYRAGYLWQLSNAIAIGNNSGNTDQLGNSIAIGNNAGYYTQRYNSIAIGNNAGNYLQNDNSIAIGYEAGKTNQGGDWLITGNGSSAIAIGYEAGKTNQGLDAIAIGKSAGLLDQAGNSIILNASGSPLNATISGFFVDPIREESNFSGSNYLLYDPNSKEIKYSSMLSLASNEFKANTIYTGGLGITSDLRLKSNIETLPSSLDMIKKLNPVRYMKKDNIASTLYNHEEMGFIAQEIQKVLPILVIEGSDKDKTLSVNYISLIPLLTKAIQEQQTHIDEKAKLTDELKKQLDRLQKEIDELRGLIKSIKK